MQVQNAAMTSDRLRQEREMRQQELEKISTLEEKIGLELTVGTILAAPKLAY